MYKVKWSIPEPDDVSYKIRYNELYFKDLKEANRFKNRLVKCYKTLWFDLPVSYVKISKISVI